MLVLVSVAGPIFFWGGKYFHPLERVYSSKLLSTPNSDWVPEEANIGNTGNTAKRPSSKGCGAWQKIRCFFSSAGTIRTVDVKMCHGEEDMDFNWQVCVVLQNLATTCWAVESLVETLRHKKWGVVCFGTFAPFQIITLSNYSWMCKSPGFPVHCIRRIRWNYDGFGII